MISSVHCQPARYLASASCSRKKSPCCGSHRNSTSTLVIHCMYHAERPGDCVCIHAGSCVLAFHLGNHSQQGLHREVGEVPSSSAFKVMPWGTWTMSAKGSSQVHPGVGEALIPTLLDLTYPLLMSPCHFPATFLFFFFFFFFFVFFFFF